MTQQDNHRRAIVLGGSMAGLLAARVLTDHYDCITVIDRDNFPEIAQHRRGVPHGRHLHVLHPRGLQSMEELLPGLSKTLIEDGAVSGDALAETRLLFSGHRFRQAPAALDGLLFSRPFLEAHVRARVVALPQVRVLERCDIIGLTAADGGKTITGVRVVPDDGDERRMYADLVVDATGRGSRAPVWLEQLGYRRPPEDRVEIGLGYATRAFRLRPGALGSDVLVIHGGTPANTRGGFLAALEGGRHMVTLVGILGDHPPTDLAGFRAFAESLIFPDIAEALVGAEPLDDGVSSRFPVSVRRRYEQLRELPARMLAIGDAVCSFNPVYGQGMTVAAIEALALGRLLARHPVPDPQRYYRRIARAVDVPWRIAVGADLAHPEVPGKRTARIRLVNSYLPKLHAAAASDPSLGRAFARVMGLLERPESLFRPDRALRVLVGNLRRRDALPAPFPSDVPIGGQSRS
jgi:2-polyprenyl-6-methoxyphenol hydroxylase-like FAD-dependent oxidoreductase